MGNSNLSIPIPAKQPNVDVSMGGTALSKGNVDTGYTYSNGSYKKNKVTGNLALTCTDQYYSISYNLIELGVIVLYSTLSLNAFLYKLLEIYT